MVPKYVDEGYNEQNWTTDSKQPQHQKVWNSGMFWRDIEILVAGW